MRNLDLAMEELQKPGFEVMAFPAHIGKSDQVAALFETINEQFGRLDILVDNVGMNLLTPSVAEVDEKLWDKIIETNLKGTFLVSSQAVRLMKKGGGGKIINITSIAGMSPPPMQGIYAITKAGVISMTKGFAKELGAHGIRVNAIAPGLTDTKFASVLIHTKEILEVALKSIPLNRYAAPVEMAGAALFLASDASAFVNGAILTIDGGAAA